MFEMIEWYLSKKAHIKDYSICQLNIIYQQLNFCVLTFSLPRALQKNVRVVAERKTVIINHHKIPQVCL